MPELQSASMKAALRRADKLGVDYVALLGGDELAKGVVTIKDFRSGDQAVLLAERSSAPSSNDGAGRSEERREQRGRQRDPGHGTPTHSLVERALAPRRGHHRRGRRRQPGAAQGVGAPAPRSWRRHLPRSARPQRHAAGGGATRGRARGGRGAGEGAAGVGGRGRRRGRAAIGRDRQHQDADRRVRGHRRVGARALQAAIRCRSISKARSRRARRRGSSYRYLDLRRDELAAQPAPAPRSGDGDDALLRRGGLPQHRDADPHPLDAGGRARLPGAEPRAPRQLLRAAAVAAALQADPPGRGRRAVRADLPLLPRRGPARRPPARVLADRRRDVVRRARRRDGGDGGAHSRGSSRWSASR